MTTNLKNHPLQGYYLLRYGRDEAGFDHKSSIFDPPAGASPNTPPDIDHVVELLERSPLARRMPEGIDEKRKYARDYLSTRSEMETYLRQQALTAGIKPENDHPLYFVLHHEANPNVPPMEGRVMIAIPGEQVPLHLVSFTVDDSFYNIPGKPTSFRDPAHGTVFNAEQIANKVQTEGWLPPFPENGMPRIIEAQLWSRRVDDFLEVEPPRPTTHPSAGGNKPGCAPERN